MTKPEIIEVAIKDIKPYDKNPRTIPNEAIEKVANSIREFGVKQPLVLDKDYVIVVGHTRFAACEKLGMGTVPCIIAKDLTDEQIRAYRLADNKTNEFSSWDYDVLDFELGELADFDMEQFGFEIEDESDWDDGGGESGSMIKNFIVPPFTTFDSAQGYWIERKQSWKQYIHSGNGRSSELLTGGLRKLAQATGEWEDGGSSIFDPVLTEVLIRWFCPDGGKIIDPFAGGSVRGLVSTYLGHRYVGVELRQEQNDANESNWQELREVETQDGAKWARPLWITGDSCNIDELVIEYDFDFLLTCPPYGDLETYSDDPKDISNMDYEDFKRAYFEIIRKACAKLKDNAFAAIVVGDIRDKKGFYRDFIGDTKQAFKEAGLQLYNDAIFLESKGTLVLRAGKVFRASRKLGKCHQNVMIFAKGDVKKILPTLHDYSQELKALEDDMEESDD